MKHIDPELNDFQIANFERLAAHLDLGVTNLQFDMGNFCTKAEEELKLQDHQCGTVACAAGHGPSLGIKPKEHEHWSSYISRVFGSGSYDEVYEWLFHGSWRHTDNTSRGAAARIWYMLKHGVPENAYEQLKGRAPLCYEVRPMPEVQPTKMKETV